MSNPKCIQCGRIKAVQPAADDMFYCTSCGALFDADPDEGGTHCTGNPAGRMEREERNLERRRNRHR